jgi:hypothetical protein
MAILADNNVTHTEFSDQVNKCLPSIPYDFTPIPAEGRRDFTDARVFTIDPAGSDGEGQESEGLKTNVSLSLFVIDVVTVYSVGRCVVYSKTR